MIVPNEVSIDSRVQKTARSAQDAGYTVTVVGAAGRDSRFSAVLNGVLTLRVPRKPLAPKSRPSQITASIHRRVANWPRLASLPFRAVARLFNAVGTRITNRTPLPYRAFTSDEVSERVRAASQLDPSIAVWTARFLRPLVDLKPDIIYVHDAILLLAGGLAQEELSRRGHPAKLVADVHEWWPGVGGTTPERIKSRTDLEEYWVPRADLVLTVSPTLSRWLTERLDLATPPVSVENAASVAVVAARGRKTIREECGLLDGTPLLVYAGAIAPARGVDVAIDAIAQIPGAHLAVVAGKRNKYVIDLEEHAQAKGMSDRIHIVSFVPPESISWYLNSATAGLAPFRRSKSHDSALATKISEYLNAKLPLVVSDCEAQGEYVSRTGVGEVFVADDVDGARIAISKVIGDRDTYVSTITEDLLRDRTWEYQAAELVTVLTSVEAPGSSRISPPPPAIDAVRISSEALKFHSAWIDGSLLKDSHSTRYDTLFGSDNERLSESIEQLGPLTPITTKARSLPVVQEASPTRGALTEHIMMERPKVDSDQSNLIVGPANSAGQGYAWAKAVRSGVTNVGSSNFTVVTSATYPFPSDYSVDVDIYRRSETWSADQRKYITENYTHALWESGRAPLGLADGRSAWEQIESLRRDGITPAFLAHGSDVRIPSQHADQFAGSPFLNVEHALTQALEKKTRDLHMHLEGFTGPRFVSTPDLLPYVPHASWLPVVADASWFVSNNRPFRTPLRVAHVTSNSMLSQSDEIDALMEPLASKGEVEYSRISGQPPSAMRGLMLEVDILLDQFGIGNYGVAACEAMALGLVVVGNVDDEARRVVLSTTGLELPVVQSELSSVPTVLRQLANDPLKLEATRQAGYKFARKVHDGRMSASILQNWLESN
jgi:glycosyltransferase involved in cell wall biosynthesis